MLEEGGDVEVASAVVGQVWVEACLPCEVVDALDGEVGGGEDEVQRSPYGLVSVDDGGAEDPELEPLCGPNVGRALESDDGLCCVVGAMARCEDLGPPYLEDAGVAVSVPDPVSKDVESGLVAARGRRRWWALASTPGGLGRATGGLRRFGASA